VSKFICTVNGTREEVEADNLIMAATECWSVTGIIPTAVFEAGGKHGWNTKLAEKDRQIEELKTSLAKVNERRALAEQELANAYHTVRSGLAKLAGKESIPGEGKEWA